MGCDGGTIPRRDELVRVKKKPEQKDKEAELAFKWRHCTIKQLPLQPPVVGCALGRLYSKESVLEGLLDRNTLPESAQHIKTLKDIKNLNLTSNPAFEGNKAKKGDCYIDERKSPYICPLIGLEMNGKYKFCFLWSCGCVMSERALKEVRSKICHQCQQPFTETDIVIINAEGDDLKLMEENMTQRKTAQKRSKKQKHNEDNQMQDVKQEEVPKKKMRKEEKNGTVKVNSNRTEAEDPAYKKVKDNYSVAKDPKASEVFKSIFTTHKSAAEQDRAHWVTYNPFYN
ncbi:replication termination factor 2 [Bombus vosnesenskii]|uniref:Replication termination factor 2 n=2 Tax=Pyrobombus TaxID=144703 RepID=A0A6J3KYH2_9HYME|nr:replication termination factor 2 [Bombus vancouverensis nearcticus]XP_033299685.1 replication termination factor 2 [Bombus bifarius]XP_033356859.1 replication termination factor 2 [Bombus vosnesenskii]XP_050487743.1 replication termination factor 2 [Bombus huntii]